MAPSSDSPQTPYLTAALHSSQLSVRFSCPPQPLRPCGLLWVGGPSLCPLASSSARRASWKLSICCILLLAPGWAPWVWLGMDLCLLFATALSAFQAQGPREQDFIISTCQGPGTQHPVSGRLGSPTGFQGCDREVSWSWETPVTCYRSINRPTKAGSGSHHLACMH